MRRLFLVGACACSVLLLAHCSGFPFFVDDCSCVEDGFTLTLPCEAAAAQIASTEATGACQGASIEQRYPQAVSVRPQREGTCHFALHFEDGSSFSTDLAIRRSSGCCAGYRPDPDRQSIAVPMEAACPDAGTPDTGTCGNSPKPSGCFTMPEFDDCNCFCKGLDVPVLGEQMASGRRCTRACACGFGTEDLLFGCKTDSDCALVRADCCGCASGGVSTAVLKANATTWESDLSAHCGSSGPCPTAYLCGQGKAVCDWGHCMVQMPDGGL